MEDAFDVEAYHYLVKPVPEERFCEVVGKAYRNTIQKKNHAEAFLTIRTSDENRRVRIEDIVYVESDRKKVTFHGHIANLSALFQSNTDKEEWGIYIGRMQKTVDRLEFSLNTGNPITDVICNRYAMQAERSGVRFHRSLHIRRIPVLMATI